MAVLMIKDLPEALHRRLKARAAANRRSVSAEAIAILESALADLLGPPTLDEIDRMRVRGARPLTEALLARARRDRR
jgi:hypothetical protein